MAVIFFRTLIVYILLSAVMRFLGKRQVGELEVSELVATLILSEIATIPIADPDIPLLFALIPILLILSLEIIVTFLKNKVSFLKYVFESQPNILIDKGKIVQAELSKNRISVEELLGELRLQGVSDPTEVNYAILEQSGQMSVILKTEKQPPSAENVGKKITEKGIAHPLVLDGVVSKRTLKRIGKGEEWLEDILKKRKCRVSDVFLCTVNDAGDITVIKREKQV